MVSACDTEEEDADENDEGPEEAGNGFERPGELLDGERGGVDGDAVHANCSG